MGLSTLPSLPSTLLPLPLDQPQSTMPSPLWTLSDLHLGQLRSTTPSPASILLGLHLAPPLSTMHSRPNSTSSRRRLTSLLGVKIRILRFFISPRFNFEL